MRNSSKLAAQSKFPPEEQNEHRPDAREGPLVTRIALRIVASQLGAVCCRMLFAKSAPLNLPAGESNFFENQTHESELHQRLRMYSAIHSGDAFA